MLKIQVLNFKNKHYQEVAKQRYFVELFSKSCNAFVFYLNNVGECKHQRDTCALIHGLHEPDRPVCWWGLQNRGGEARPMTDP
jgi:hypothetical protein